MKREETISYTPKFAHKEDVEDEIVTLRAILLEKDAEMDKLKQQLDIYIGKLQISICKQILGEKLEDLSTTNLQELANKSINTYNTATDLIVKRLEEEQQKIILSNTCGLCLNGKVDTVMIPCGHVHFCYSCAQKMCTRGKCFVCNEMVASILKVYIQ
jgi:hypothetical protein